MGVYYISGIPYSSDYLMHFGIKGQKWGVRRFQNEDGTLTVDGKKRYARDLRSLNRLHRKEKQQLDRVTRREKSLYSAKYGWFGSESKAYKAERRLHESRISYDKYVKLGKKKALRIQKRFGNVNISELNSVRDSMPVKWKKYL